MHLPLSPQAMRKKLEKLLENNNIPITLVAKEIGVAFPTLYSFLHNTRQQRYMVLVKINKFLKRFDEKKESLEH